MSTPESQADLDARTREKAEHEALRIQHEHSDVTGGWLRPAVFGASDGLVSNFALIAGIRPQEVEDWFLVVYADAYEWVELPNVAAMALWTDKGRLASKPYAASGNYINKMSDYCGACRYDVKQKIGPDACPFNSLYWHFMVRHRRLFENNVRISRLYGTWNKMAPEKQQAYLETAEAFLAKLVPAAEGWARV